MATSSSEVQSTPPHHPTFEVSLTTACINEIVEKCLPGTRLLAVEQLQCGKSFNNRIYYLDVRASSPGINQSSAAEEQKLVLKLNGRFFGSEKVENEVGCLQLLEAYCPSIPAPKVIAWSKDGEAITTRLGLGTSVPGTPISIEPTNQVGWILMTRLPGEPLSDVHPNPTEMPKVIAELAEHVANWRQQVPAQSCCGSIRFNQRVNDQVPGRVNIGNPILRTLGLSVGGLVTENLYPSEAIESLEDYYRIRITAKIDQLQTKEAFKRNRSILPLLDSFVKNGLSRLKFISTEGEPRLFLFTHYDLSPRNILISGSPPHITGIVDFEFAGFFSQYEEFTNDRVNNNGDWSKEAYHVYLEGLKQRGINTPHCGFNEIHWQQSLQLEEIIQNIAPWWLPGEHTGNKLEHEMQKSEELIRDRLGALVGNKADPSTLSERRA